MNDIEESEDKFECVTCGQMIDIEDESPDQFKCEYCYCEEEEEWLI
jgi:hypothetical protein